jgi:outer membrane murein-binding lipoprotein Lpp
LQEKHEKNMAAGLEESEKKRTFAGKSQTLLAKRNDCRQTHKAAGKTQNDAGNRITLQANRKHRR